MTSEDWKGLLTFVEIIIYIGVIIVQIYIISSLSKLNSNKPKPNGLRPDKKLIRIKGKLKQKGGCLLMGTPKLFKVTLSGASHELLEVVEWVITDDIKKIYTHENFMDRIKKIECLGDFTEI